PRGEGVAGNFQVFGIAAECVDVHSQCIRAELQASNAGAFLRGGVAPNLHDGAVRVLHELRWDTSVDDVHDAADGAAAEQQRGGTFENLDLIGQYGLDSDRVIRAQARHIQR